MNSLDWVSMIVSLKLAAITTVILIGLCAPLAYLMARVRFPGQSFVDALISLPMALPPTVIGFYLVILMGPKGPAGRNWEHLSGGALLFTFPGIVAAAAICSLPYAMQPMKAAFQKMDPKILESAYVLGLSRLQTFVKVVLPNSLGGIAAASILVFLHTLGAFGVILMVGGSVAGETRVASIAIYEAVESMNYTMAGLMSLCFVPVSFAFLMLINKLNERHDEDA